MANGLFNELERVLNEFNGNVKAILISYSNRVRNLAGVLGARF